MDTGKALHSEDTCSHQSPQPPAVPHLPEQEAARLSVLGANPGGTRQGLATNGM